MGRINEMMIRRRAEHNEYMLSTLEEVALHQQNIEKIELLGQLCPNLKILYMQNNLISKIENLHKLKDLQYLNLALNNITKVQNLQRCESLSKLDLTVNFIPLAGLLSIASLAGNYHLKDLYLTGNPCTDWPGYRPYVVATLPQLQKLDGTEILRSERIRAQQQLPDLHHQLLSDLRAAGIDPVAAAEVEDDSCYDPDQEVAETGYLDPESGEMKRPWCPATRILEHREQEAANREAEQRKASSQEDPFAAPVKPRLEDFPPAPADGVLKQKNEGDWDFSLDESDDGAALVLEVAVGKYLDTSLIKTDLQPRYVRLLIKGRLLQLNLPVEVRPDAATAQRSKCSGRLVLTLPKEVPDERVTDVTHLRPRAAQEQDQATKPTKGTAGGIRSIGRAANPAAASAACAKGPMTKGKAVGSDLLRAVQRATVTEAAAGDSDEPPDL